MSLSIYHGNEEWILKGFGVDLARAFSRKFPNIHVERYESFISSPGSTKFHLFVQQGQLSQFVSKSGEHLLSSTICIFTHFDIKQFPCKILNKCLAVLFMSSSQLSVAVANGLDSSKAMVCPIGVDQNIHNIYDQSSMSQLLNGSPVLQKMSSRTAVGFVTRYWGKPAYVRRKRYKLIIKVADILSQMGINVIILGPGWKDCKDALNKNNVVYVNTPYKNYPIIYNLMRVYCSLSLHEGGPVPLLESMSCGVRPVVTNTGFASDVLKGHLDAHVLPINEDIHNIIGKILDAHASYLDSKFYRSIASSYTFDKVTEKVASLMGMVI